MNGRGKKKPWRSPHAFVTLVTVMLAMILALVVFSSEKEEEIAQKKGGERAAVPQSIEEIKPVSSPSKEKVIITEDGNAAVNTDVLGFYRNNVVYTVSTGYGMSLSIGLEMSGDADALYINPHFSYEYAGNPDEAYCYLLKTERVPLEYAKNNPGPANSFANQNVTDFAIRGRTYDRVVPAAFTDTSNYGVCWKDNSGMGGRAHDGDLLRILIIRISDGTLMGAAQAEITYDEAKESYQFVSLVNADVSVTGELSAGQRENLVQDTFTYLLNGNEQMSFGVTLEELEAQRPFIVVERPGRTYYNRLYDKDGRSIAKGTLSNCDIYAVNINYYGFGFFTVYFAPEPQAHGLRVEKLSEDGEPKLVIVGYDAFAPMTVDTFNSFLYADDVDLFGAAQYGS